MSASPRRAHSSSSARKQCRPASSLVVTRSLGPKEPLHNPQRHDHLCRRSCLSRGSIPRGHPLHAANAGVRLLNHMVQYMTTRLDTSFAALSDATRRGVLEQLGRADASITDLAEKFHMTLTGMKKHVGVLEQAGLVTTKKIGRVRNCQLGPRRLEEETAWLERYRQRWDERFDELDKVVEELTRKEKSDEGKNRK